MTGRRFRHGLIVGKFYPPHKGHLTVIEDAACSCDRVSVIVAAAAAEKISLSARVDWLGWAAAGWPNVSVIGTMDDHRIDYDDPMIWDAHEAVFREAAERSRRAFLSTRSSAARITVTSWRAVSRPCTSGQPDSQVVSRGRGCGPM